MTLITPEFLRTQRYEAVRDRLALAHGGNVQAGVWDAGDFKVTQRAAGANMSVDVAAGFALIQANNAGNAGLYHAENDATVNVAFTASHGSLPRVDQVFYVINDSEDGNDTSDLPALTVVAGTPTSGATLDNRTGVGAVPENALRLADVLVPAASTTVTTANIRDRRPWARGARYVYERAAGSYTLASSSFTALDAANILPRLETSGGPVVVQIYPQFLGVNAVGYVEYSLSIDGDADTRLKQIHESVANNSLNGNAAWIVAPAAGSHTFSVRWRASTGTATMGAQVYFEVKEEARPSAQNA